MGKPKIINVEHIMGDTNHVCLINERGDTFASSDEGFMDFFSGLTNVKDIDQLEAEKKDVKRESNANYSAWVLARKKMETLEAEKKELERFINEKWYDKFKDNKELKATIQRVNDSLMSDDEISDKFYTIEEDIACQLQRDRTLKALNANH